MSTTLSLSHTHANTLAVERSRQWLCREPARVYKHAPRAVLCCTYSTRWAPVVTVRKTIGAREFSATPKAYLCALSLSRSRCSETCLSSATLLVEDDENLRCGSGGAQAELPALRTPGAMPIVRCYYNPGNAEVTRRFILREKDDFTRVNEY